MRRSAMCIYAMCLLTARLLAKLTYLPLAIVQASAYINTNAITVPEYISLLDQKEEEAIDILSEDYEDQSRYQEIKNPVATTWLVSFEQIKRSDALAAEYLSFIACISPHSIPLSLLPCGQSRKQEINAIGTLSAYAFVTRQPGGDSLDIHRLVHLTARNWLRNQGSLAQWTMRTTSRICELFTAVHQDKNLLRMLFPHAWQVLASEDAPKQRDQLEKLFIRYIYAEVLSGNRFQ